MSADRFADRLDAETFADDPVVGVYEDDPDADDALWVAERLFARITTVAVAYELHTLPLLGSLHGMTLNRVRCESLLEEVAFVAERLNDPLAHQVANALQDYIASRTRDPLWDGTITVE